MRGTAFGSFSASVPLAVLLAVVTVAAPVEGAMIVTGGEVLTSGGVSPVGPASFALIGGGGSAGDPFKLSGGGTFVSDGTPGSITFRTTGTIQFIPGEEWHVAWDFSTDISGGDATWQVDWQSNCPIFGTIHLQTPELPLSDGYDEHDGSFGFPNILFWTSQQLFQADIIMDWDAAAGDTFTVTIPDNSIDFDVRTVPEPAAMSVLLLGGAALLRRRVGARPD